MKYLVNSKLTNSIVRILDSTSQTIGTGFVLTDDGLIATCAHVIESAGIKPGDTVNLIFHHTKNEAIATVEPEGWRESNAEDIAILSLVGNLPDEIAPVLLGTGLGTAHHPIQTFGFPNLNPEGGVLGDGHILGETTMRGVQVLQLSSTQITPGFSGAPVLDMLSRRIVGMVVSIAIPDQYGRLAETAFVTPTETLQAVYPALHLSDLCPYRSLEVFTEADAEFFFGREKVVERLIESLRREPRFLAVLGPSGSGKSSLIQAGLILWLRNGRVSGSDHWGIILTRPTDQPFNQLEAQGLLGAHENITKAVQAWLEGHPEHERLVLVLDQFEELMTTTPEEVRLAFLTQLMMLLETSLPVTLVLVVRDDFYSRFIRETTGLLPWLERGLANVPSMLTRAELQDIIEEPARTAGLTFEPGLVATILQDVLESTSTTEKEQVGHSTVLPLLEFALTQLWKRREGSILTHNVYQNLGRVTGGLTQWADQAYYGLEKEQQRLARYILTDLVHLGDERQGLPDSRRRRLVGDLYRFEHEPETIHRVVRWLASARLLVTGREREHGKETVELIHEALLREWGLLQGWLAEDRRFLAWRQMLESQLLPWIESAPAELGRRDAGRLLRGRALVEAERWLIERKNDLRVEEQAFIQIGLTRAKRVRFLLVSVTSFAFLVVSLLALLAWSQRNEAVHEAEVRATAQAQAETQGQIALARQLAAQARIEIDNVDPERGTLLAIESLQRLSALGGVSRLDGDQAVRHGLALLPRPLTQMMHADAVQDLDFSPDGRLLVTASRDRTARVWELASGKEILRLPHGDSVLEAKFSSDGRQLITKSGQNLMPDSEVSTNTLKVWDVISGQEIATLSFEHRIGSVIWDSSGKWLAIEIYGRTTRIWDLMTKQVVISETFENEVLSANFSPDKKWLIVKGKSFNIWLVRVNKEKEIIQIEHDYNINSTEFNSKGNLLVTASDDQTARVWDVSSGQEIIRVAHEDEVKSASFSPDNKWIATASYDGTARVWDVDTGKEIARIVHDGKVYSVDFSPDGKWLATYSDDFKIRIWEITTGREVAFIHGDWISKFTPDGKWLVTAGQDGLVRIWEINGGGDEVARMIHNDWVYHVDFSPSSKYLATAGADRTARIWEATNGREVARMEHPGDVWTAVFSPDGEWLATVQQYMNNSVRIWNSGTGTEVTSISDDGHAQTAIFSPDNKWLAVDYGSKILIFQMETLIRGGNQSKYEIPTSPDPTFLKIAFSLNSRWLVADGLEYTVKVWDYAANQVVAQIKHNDPVLSAVLSPDGKWLASTNAQMLKIWNFSNKELTEIPFESRVGPTGFSPDSKWFAAYGEGDIIKIWNVSTWIEETQIIAEGKIEAIAFSPNGEWLATASYDGTARVWEVATGQENARVLHDNRVLDVTFSPDGRYLATASDDHSARVWLWHYKDLIKDACTRLNRNLTIWEWRQYIGNEPYHKTCSNLPIHPSFVELGIDLARNEDIKGATAQFQKALKLDPDLNLYPADPSVHLEPEVAARWYASAEVVKKGEDLAKMGKIQEAIATYKKAQGLLEPISYRISGDALNTLCRFGGLWAQATEVITICNQAVDLEPDNGQFHDSRGLALALLGDYKGAIEDFKFYLEWSKSKASSEQRTKREEWIVVLEANQSPFDTETLEVLRNQ